MAVVLYDLLNDVSLASGLGKRQGEKKLLLKDLRDATEVSDLLVFDSHYADYDLLALAEAEGREIVVWLPRSRFKVVEAFWQSDSQEQIVEIGCPTSARKFVEENSLSEKLRVRLIRILLSDGETEVLATTLRDKEKYVASDFKQLYGLRWNEETFFDRIKNIFEVERFSGKSAKVVRQDFYGVLFLASFQSILAKSDQEALEEKSADKNQKRSYQSNCSISYVALLDRVVKLLLSAKQTETILEELHHLFRANPTQIRPNRHNERNKELRYAHKLRYNKYRKRLSA